MFHYVYRLTIWLDAEDISAGCDWYGAIGQGLENCKGIIAVITNKYINSHYCKSELYTANNDRKHIFPIIFEDVDFSSSATAKGVKYIISGINWTMFRPSVDDYHTSLDKLCQGMKEQGRYNKLYETHYFWIVISDLRMKHN